MPFMVSFKVTKHLVISHKEADICFRFGDELTMREPCVDLFSR